MSNIFKSTYGSGDYPSTPLHKLVLDAAKKYGDRVAYVDYDTKFSLTFKQIVDYCNNFAQQLIQTHGAKKGDVVAICMANHPLYVVATHGTLSAGCTLTTLNPLYKADSIKKQLLNSEAKWMITIAPCLKEISEAIKGTSVQKIFLLDQDVSKFKGVLDFKSLLAPLKKQVDLSKIKFNTEEDVAFLPYSSGTTGVSKGVMLTHANLVSNIIQGKVILSFEPTEIFSGILPLFHIFGIYVLMNLSIIYGVKVITLARFDFVKFLTMIQVYKISRCHLVPPIVLALAKHPVVDKFDVTSLKHILSGAAPLSGELVAVIKKRLNCVVTQGYGLTETSPIICAQPDDEPIVGACGRLVRGLELRIVDVETGKDLDYGQRGEVVVRGPNVMKGYLKRPDATKHCVKDGWFFTGDIGVYKKNHQLYIVDRLKELIKYKGFQVPPAELEAILLTSDKIADAAVIGVADDVAGELPKAFVVLKANVKMTEKDVIDFVASKVSPQKKVRLVEFTDKIPKSGSGKILRRILRDKQNAKKK